MVAGLGPSRAEGLMQAEAALPLLRAGGLNLYMRHAITDRSQVDTGRRGDRAGQRNIDARGRSQAQSLGEAFRRLGIPVSAVWTSEVFRARDTAELAFGRAEIVEALIADDYTPRNRWRTRWPSVACWRGRLLRATWSSSGTSCPSA